MVGVLRGGRALGSRRFGRLSAITLVEAVDASGRVNEFLLAGEERMASRTDFDLKVFLAGRARLKRLAASTVYRNFFVFGMNSLFHFWLPQKERRRRCLRKRDDSCQGGVSSS